MTTFEMLARGRDRMSALAEDRWADSDDENDKQNDDEDRCSDADVHAPPLSSVEDLVPAAYSSANILGARMSTLDDRWAAIDPVELAAAALEARRAVTA